jgi:signal transduction histidine kinase
VTFRTRLVLVSAITTSFAVSVVAWVVSVVAQRAFEERDRQRAAAVTTQFRREFTKRGAEVARRLERIAQAESVQTLALDLAKLDAGAGPYDVEQARALAAEHGLDFLEITRADGTIVSSAQWPARFGYRTAVAPPGGDPFLKREELPNETALGMFAVRAVEVGGSRLLLTAGERLDREFLRSLTLPADTRVLLYRNLQPEFHPAALIDASGPVAGGGRLRDLIESVRSSKAARTARVGAESFEAVPLIGRKNELLAVLLIANSHAAAMELVSFIRRLGFGAGGAGILLGVAIGWWATARVTRPVKELAGAARHVAAGDWNTRVAVSSGDEIGELAAAFNTMTRQLLEQRDRLVQAERVAAWRELARRLAHELKNPLFPLQITIENLQRARALAPEEFEEVFQESTHTLLAELQNLKTIIQRFSDFAKMPPPRLEPADVNQAAEDALRLFEAQMLRAGIHIEKALSPELPRIPADPEQLTRAIRNLVLNAMDAMPGGGTLSVRSLRHDGFVRLEISDTGQGLTAEECERLFTPYYTTKQHGTGLGLAIVQSVVSDHKGRIAVESAPGKGATFRIDLPMAS